MLAYIVGRSNIQQTHIMALYYDEILAGNCFGQINVTLSPPISTSTTDIDTTELPNFRDEFEFSIEELFYIGQKFLRGIFRQINEYTSVILQYLYMILSRFIQTRK